MSKKDKALISFNTNISVVLFMIFLVLKLTNLIHWSWVWVFAPLWIPFVPIIAIISIIVLVKMISDTVDYFIGKG